MKKEEIIAYFDRAAKNWDAAMVTDDKKIEIILDAAGVREGVTVLDVACGTGVLFSYYLRRNVAGVIGVDVSPEMARIAESKARDPRVEILCGDMETIPIHRVCDCCVVYNAFPHFWEPERLIRRLAQWVRPGGRITVAHGMSLEALRRHHTGRAEHVSREMMQAEELAELFEPWVSVDTMVSDDEKYIVSGERREPDGSGETEKTVSFSENPVYNSLIKEVMPYDQLHPVLSGAGRRVPDAPSGQEERRYEPRQVDRCGREV